MIQAKKNRQEKVIISVIEEVLDNEFAEYQKQLCLIMQYKHIKTATWVL